MTLESTRTREDDGCDDGCVDERQNQRIYLFRRRQASSRAVVVVDRRRGRDRHRRARLVAPDPNAHSDRRPSTCVYTECPKTYYAHVDAHARRSPRTRPRSRIGSLVRPMSSVFIPPNARDRAEPLVPVPRARDSRARERIESNGDDDRAVKRDENVLDFSLQTVRCPRAFAAHRARRATIDEALDRVIARSRRVDARVVIVIVNDDDDDIDRAFVRTNGRECDEHVIECDARASWSDDGRDSSSSGAFVIVIGVIIDEFAFAFVVVVVVRCL